MLGGLRHAHTLLLLGLALGSAQAAEPPTPRPLPRGRPVIVAVVDDAFALGHDDLAGLWRTNAGEIPGNGLDDDGNGRVDDVIGWDVADGDAGVEPPEERRGEFPHGTHLAGVVAEVVHSAYGDRVGDAIRLLPVKALADRFDRPYLESGFDGIAYALDAGADVILCSWNVNHLKDGQRSLLERAEAAGVLVVGSSGNAGNDTPSYPAAHETVISVAALDAGQRKLTMSSFGVTVDVAALGEDVEGPDVLHLSGRSTMTGTSPAAAWVAGVVAVLRREHPNASPATIRALLLDGAHAVERDDPRLAASMGAGKVDLQASLALSPTAFGGLWKNAAGAVPIPGGLRETTGLMLLPPGSLLGIRLALDAVAGSARARSRTSLEVYAGSSTESAMVWSGSLDTFPSDLFVPSHRAYIRIHPGRGRGAALLRYRAEPLDVSTRYCSGVVEVTEPGLIEDGSGDAPYAPTSSCKWLVTAPDGQRVRFSVRELDLEASTDQVLFFDGDSTARPVIAGLSGTTSAPEILSWGPAVLVWFVTNDRVQQGGFQLQVDFEPVPED